MASVSLFVSALAGAAGGVAARVLHTVYKQSRRRKQLRRSLYVEVRENSEHTEPVATRLKTVDPSASNVVLPKDTVTTTVYTSNAGSLGLLSRDENETVVRYYSRCNQFQRLLAAIDDCEEISPPNVALLRETAIELHESSIEVLCELESNLSIDEKHSDNLEQISLEDEHTTRPPSEQVSVSTDH
ncbi:hypothetical protein [Halobaculum sp. MBLA0143]|uniref:hypothetical protein n=1 Tax=Halobaculum sp. MBLA0143 TaxID=3079933 RepID=UPI003525D551